MNEIKQKQNQIQKSYQKIRQLEEEIQKLKGSPNAPEIQNLINRTKDCINGKRFQLECKKYDVVFTISMFWEYDKEPNFIIHDVDPKIPNAKLKKFFDILIKSLDYDTLCYDLKDLVEPDVYKCQEYKDFAKEIVSICKEADRLEDKYGENFDFDEDILCPAERLAKNRVWD